MFDLLCGTFPNTQGQLFLLQCVCVTYYTFAMLNCNYLSVYSYHHHFRHKHLASGNWVMDFI